MSETDEAMADKVPCEILCHNLTCLMQEQETLGVAPVLWKDEAAGGVRRRNATLRFGRATSPPA
jgi:hypothetical protein